MRTLKIVSFSTFLLYIIGFLFLIFRKTDGAGVTNSLNYEIISITIWSFLFSFIFIVLLILYIIFRKRNYQKWAKKLF